MSEFDVIVVGDGLFARSCIQALTQLKCNRVAQIKQDQVRARFQDDPGYLIGRWIDNFTRIQHAFGNEVARDLWRFAEHALTSVESLFPDVAGYCSGDLYRVLESQHEIQEASLAVKLQNHCGFTSEIIPPPQRGTFTQNLKDHVYLQVDTAKSGCLDPEQMLHHLTPAGSVHIVDARVEEIKEREDGVQVFLESGQQVSSHFLIFADAQILIELYPHWKNILIPYGNQWAEFELKASFFEPGSTYIFRHGADILHSISERSFRFTGGRRLRKLAGVGQSVPTLSNEFLDYFRDLVRMYWQAAPNYVCVRQQAFVDFRTCDELPLIGPLSGQHRMLMGCGFMGQESTWGFAAGKCVAEIVMTGTCAELPRLFWPERLRSLSEA